MTSVFQRGTLRGPQARRTPDAPVTMRGWLDKQGSERLRLWKTRWFVLAEYCLYYYKGELGMARVRSSGSSVVACKRHRLK